MISITGYEVDPMGDTFRGEMKVVFVRRRTEAEAQADMVRVCAVLEQTGVVALAEGALASSEISPHE